MNKHTKARLNQLAKSEEEFREIFDDQDTGLATKVHIILGSLIEKSLKDYPSETPKATAAIALSSIGEAFSALANECEKKGSTLEPIKMTGLVFIAAGSIAKMALDEITERGGGLRL